MPNESSGRCEIADCGIDLIGESMYDKYLKKRVCPTCFERTFRSCQESGFGEWFESNYDRSAYPPEFWRSVGAFVDLSKTTQKAYK